MKRLWAFIVRLTTLHQENDRIIRRAERLNERQRVLAEETGNYLADQLRGVRRPTP